MFHVLYIVFKGDILKSQPGGNVSFTQFPPSLKRGKRGFDLEVENPPKSPFRKGGL
jgi:hypothetical protein